MDAGMLPVHVGDVLDTGANPGRHDAASTADAPVVLLHALPADPSTPDVAVPLGGARHTPLLSASMPRAAHAAMPASCRDIAVKLAIWMATIEL